MVNSQCNGLKANIQMKIPNLRGFLASINRENKGNIPFHSIRT